MKKSRMLKVAALLLPLLLFSIWSFGQSATVQGTTKDVSGSPIPGVTVFEKGTNKGTVTNMDGQFSLQVGSESSILVFSFVGMQTQEVIVGNQTNLNIVMKAVMSDLEEVMVIGYGVQKKKLVTGSTIQVGADDLQKQNTVNALEAIQSMSPGVDIVQSSGMPGEGFKVNIRGIGTIGNSSPLYVIDGVAGGDINNLNPADIESIDVLKDAASAAIYGARAANGVILVTTKQGRKGKNQISYDGYYGWQNIYKMPELLNAQQYMDILNEARVNDGSAPYDWAATFPALYQKIQSGQWNGTNWMEEGENKNAVTQNHAVNITGGSDYSTFSIGFSYATQEGIIGKPVTPVHDKYTARINSDHVIYRNDAGMDVFKVGETFNYSYRETSGIGIGNIYSNDVHNLLIGSPLVPVFNDAGEYYAKDDLDASGLSKLTSRIYNPIADMVYSRGMNVSKNHAINSSFYAELQPIKNLKLRSSFGYRMIANSYRNFQPSFNLAGDKSNSVDRTNQNARTGYSWTFENTLSYAFRVNDHAFDVVAGQSVEKTNIGEHVEIVNGYSMFNDFKYGYIDNTQGLTPGVTSLRGYPLDYSALASFFGRANYNYKEKYLLTLVARADGSSNFAKGNQWGFFPSVSAGWVVTEESFMDDLAAFDFLKLRASWGQNGNSSIDPYQFLSIIAFNSENNYTFGVDKAVQQTGAFPRILPNKDITWETSDQINIGVDAYFLNSRLNAAFDWYNKTTVDWLVDAPMPDILGAEPPFVNGGDVSNKGLELSLRWNDRVGDLTYGAQFNLARYKNEVTRLANSEGLIRGRDNVISETTSNMYRAEVGYPIGYFWGYKTEGIFQNQQQIDNTKAKLQGNPVPGDVIFADTNGDEVINSEDKVMIGNPHPDMRIGFGLNLGYKGFDFSVSGKGAFGHQIAKSYRSFADNEFHNYTTEILDRWTGEGTSNRLPRMTTGSHVNRKEISDLYIEDADFVKIQNLTIGYDFKKLVPNMLFGQARIYLSVQNLATFTKYSGMDPEVGYGDGNGWASGIDLGFYPSPRTVIMGVNLRF
jgi:TonB-dependent starch-binding outer membrane protein SusC